MESSLKNSISTGGGGEGEVSDRPVYMEGIVYIGGELGQFPDLRKGVLAKKKGMVFLRGGGLIP